MGFELIFDTIDEEEKFISIEKKSKRENLKTDKNSQSTEDYKIERILGVISVVAGIVALSVLTWVIFIHPSEKVVGESFIKYEFTFHTPFYVFHFKPITIFVISAFVFWIFGLESIRTKLSTKIPLILNKLIFLFFIIVIFVFSYELILNFFFWAGAFILTSGEKHIDTLSYPMNPISLTPRNFNFITKIYALYLFCGLYGAYFFHQIIKIGQYFNLKEKSVQARTKVN